MGNKQIIFTAPNTAELVDVPTGEPGEFDVLVDVAYSTISPGTERANITGDMNIAPGRDAAHTHGFPRKLGYSAAGTVIKVGSRVTHVKVGDRVVVCFGVHTKYSLVNESKAIKILDDSISLEEAAMSVIATFPAAGLRKTRPEFGESAIVMGLGLLGQLAVQFCRAAGCAPVIAVDPIEERRAYAEKMGADYTFDPFAPDFVQNVKKVTNGKGVNVAVEVTGGGKALDQVLDCMARFGRVSLLGCTRSSDFTIDYYRKVHFPGITLVGAHTAARPNCESAPGYWCYDDELYGIFKLLKGGRIHFKDMIAETHLPEEAPEVYTRLVHEKNFPLVVQFDWTKMN